MTVPVTEKPFTWVPFYRELSLCLLAYRERQIELVTFLDGLRANGLAVTPLEDKDESGQRFLLKEIDPFTFFGVFNRGVSEKNRRRLTEEVKRFFDVKADLPRDFAGIPILNNQRSWFFSYSAERRPDDVPTLWRLFECAVKPDPLAEAKFGELFDRALAVRGVNVNLTMGLFWIRPDVFLSVDSTMRSHTGLKLPPKGLQYASYRSMLESVKERFSSDFLHLSHQAWLAAQEPDNSDRPPSLKDTDQNIDYWLVGAYWDEREPPDLTDVFLKEGRWENGYTDRFTDLVKQMRVGDRIAIKAATTQKEGLPFDARGKTVSRLLIKATGTITDNPGDGRNVDVEWDPVPTEPRSWYFYTARTTVWRVRKEHEYGRRLIVSTRPAPS